MGDLIGPRLYSCYKCRNPVALHDDIVSKGFQKIRTVNRLIITEKGHIKELETILEKEGDKKGFFFQSKNGRAFLFSHAHNVLTGPKEDRQLMTGLHRVADIHCVDCREVLGWKYEKAYEESQKYKEGKVVLEKYKIVKENW